MNDAIFLLDEAIQVKHYLRGGGRKRVNTMTAKLYKSVLFFCKNDSLKGCQFGAFNAAQSQLRRGETVWQF